MSSRAHGWMYRALVRWWPGPGLSWALKSWVVGWPCIKAKQGVCVAPDVRKIHKLNLHTMCQHKLTDNNLGDSILWFHLIQAECVCQYDRHNRQPVAIKCGQR